MTVNVNFAAMQTAAEDVLTCHRALTSEREGLDQFMTTLRGTWHGQAGQNWQGVQNHWYEACDQANAILYHLFDALEMALTNYKATESYLESLWGG